MILHAAALLRNIVQHKKNVCLSSYFCTLVRRRKKNKQYWLHLDLVMCFMEHTLWLCEPLCFWVLNCSTINLVLDIFYFKSNDFRLVIGINHFFCLVFSYFSDFLKKFCLLFTNIHFLLDTEYKSIHIHSCYSLFPSFESRIWSFFLLFFLVFMQKQKIKINHLQRN